MRKILLTTSMTIAVFAGAAQAERLTEAPLVDASWLEGHLGNESLVVIDVRDPAKGGSMDYTKGHIPGAIAAPYDSYGWRATVNGVPGMLPLIDDISAKIGALGISNDKHVVIVSEGTDASEFGKATRVYWTLKVLGHDAISILDGGNQSWVAAGKPVETEGVAPIAATFTANLREELLATTDEVRAAIENDVALIDGRPKAQYSGQQKAGPARVAGTIPTAVNIENSSFYSAGGFTAADAINKLTSGAGLAPKEESIAFCNTGHWASVVWFGLSEVEGRDNVAMYDGSMAEWTKDEANPVQ